MSLFKPAPRIKIGATVLYYDCRGCMADDHRVEWVGQVTGYRDENVYGGDPVTRKGAVCRVVKRGARDIRDEDLGEQVVMVDDGALQELTSGLWAIFK